MSSSNSDNSRSNAEVEHLNRLEAIVRRGLHADLEVGDALAEIDDTWLYRATHDTFETYLRDRWGISLLRAEQLIRAAEAAGPAPAGTARSAPPAESHARPLAPVAPDGADALAGVWERARQELGGDDVTAIELHLTIHRRQQPPEASAWLTAQGPAPLAPRDQLRQLRWLMAEASGTIANIAHQLDTHASELDEDACDQLRDDLLVLDEDLEALKALLPAPVDWDAAHGRLMAGELPPFEDDSDEDDEDD